MSAKVLVVEDHDDCRDVLSIQLKCLGYDVIEAETGAEGIQKALAHLPNVVIMDLGLPDMSGIETTERLKKDPRTADIPVIAHTAWGEPEFRTSAEKAGVVAFLTKPTPPFQFRATIEMCLRR